MSTATWEPAAVQVHDESEDFSIALTLDMNEYQRLVWIILVLTVWSIHWPLREKHVLSLSLWTKSHFWSVKICAMMFAKHFQVFPPSSIPLRVP